MADLGPLYAIASRRLWTWQGRSTSQRRATSQSLSKPQGLATEIHLYTTNLASHGSGPRYLTPGTPIDVIAHWALAINGRVYELARNRTGAVHDTDATHVVMITDENEWIDKMKAQGRVVREKRYIGRMLNTHSEKDLAQMANDIWTKCLDGKYGVYDRNCQVFCQDMISMTCDSETVQHQTSVNHFIGTCLMAALNNTSRGLVPLLYGFQVESLGGMSSISAKLRAFFRRRREKMQKSRMQQVKDRLLLR